MQTNRTRIFFIALLLIGCSETRTQTSASAPECNAQITGHLPPEITEASGLAVSRRNPGLFWVHNDDPPAMLFAIDSTGTIKGRIHVEGISGNLDWEDIAVAPCGGTTCLYVADIGDNRHDRSSRVVYRITEPLASDSVSDRAVAFPFVLGPTSDDAEALFVHQNHLYIISKGRRGAITLYRFPEPMRADAPVELTPIERLSAGLVQLPDMVTGAGTTQDDRHIVIRTYSSLQIYTMDNDQLQPVLKQAFSLEPLHEFQGEGVDIRDDGTAFLVSEKGLSDSAPPVSRVHCTM